MSNGEYDRTIQIESVMENAVTGQKTSLRALDLEVGTAKVHWSCRLDARPVGFSPV